MSTPPRHPPASLVGCILARDATTALRRAEAIAPLCDLVEFRLDAMETPDVEALVAGSSRPAILTCRRLAEGGRYSGAEPARLDLLRRAFAAGAAYVDLEPDAIGRLGDRGAARVIGSVHDADGIPADLTDRIRGLRDDGADIVKVAVAACDLDEVTFVLDLLAEESTRGPITAHAMGEVGRISRLVAPRFGSVLVYAAPAPGLEAATGQASVHDHRLVLRTHRIGRSTRLHAVLGADVSRSPSPAVMNAAFESLGLDRAYVPFSCSDAVDALRRLPGDLFDGLSVTIPHKETLDPILDDLGAMARRTGAVNTVVRRDDGSRRGENTDAPAVLDALRGSGADLEGRTAIVVGAGGAARAAVAALVDVGADVAITARTESRAVELASRCGGRAVGVDAIPWDRATVVVQTTPLGATPSDPMPFDPARVRTDAVVLDAVTVPPVTRVLRALMDRGVTAVSGLEMFLAQARRQVRMWTAHDVPDAVLREAAVRHLDRMRPIVLTGLRGAGKSTVGPRLADHLGRAYLDTDDVVTRETGRTPGEILRADGEARFRALETEAVRAALARSETVIALGGGAVESEATRCLLSETARVILLDASDATLLARIRNDPGRPPLTDRTPAEEIAALRARREPTFRALAAIRVRTDSPANPSSVVTEIVRALAETGIS